MAKEAHKIKRQGNEGAGRQNFQHSLSDMMRTTRHRLGTDHCGVNHGQTKVDIDGVLMAQMANYAKLFVTSLILKLK